jgi:hypothetical protein
MCSRKPLLVSDDDLKFLCELTKFKEKNVSRSVKALINLYRDLDPTMLPKQYRGRRDEADNNDENNANLLGKRLFMQGVSEVCHRVDGAELLGEDANGKSIETERFLTNEDFRRIKLLKKKQLYKKGIEKFAENTTGEKAAAKPEFDILVNRKKLKVITTAVANGELEPEDVEHLDEQYEDEGVEQWKKQIDDFVDYKDQNASDDDDDSDEDLTKPYDRNHGFLSANDMMKFVPNKEKRFEMARLEMKMKKLEGHGG